MNHAQLQACKAWALMPGELQALKRKGACGIRGGCGGVGALLCARGSIKGSQRVSIAEVLQIVLHQSLGHARRQGHAVATTTARGGEQASNKGPCPQGWQMTAWSTDCCARAHELAQLRHPRHMAHRCTRQMACVAAIQSVCRALMAINRPKAAMHELNKGSCM